MNKFFEQNLFRLGHSFLITVVSIGLSLFFRQLWGLEDRFYLANNLPLVNRFSGEYIPKRSQKPEEFFRLRLLECKSENTIQNTDILGERNQQNIFLYFVFFMKEKISIVHIFK